MQPYPAQGAKQKPDAQQPNQQLHNTEPQTPKPHSTISPTHLVVAVQPCPAPGAKGEANRQQPHQQPHNTASKPQNHTTKLVPPTWWLQYRPALLHAPKAKPTLSRPTSSGTLAATPAGGVSSAHATMQAAGITKARPCAILRTVVRDTPRLTRPSATGPTCYSRNRQEITMTYITVTGRRVTNSGMRWQLLGAAPPIRNVLTDYDILTRL